MAGCSTYNKEDQAHFSLLPKNNRIRLDNMIEFQLEDQILVLGHSTSSKQDRVYYAARYLALPRNHRIHRQYIYHMIALLHI